MTPDTASLLDWLSDDVTKWYLAAIREQQARWRAELFERNTDVSLDLARGRDEGVAYATLMVEKLLRAKKERNEHGR